MIVSIGNTCMCLSAWRREPVREGEIKDAEGGEITGRADGGCVPTEGCYAQRREARGGILTFWTGVS